MSDQNKISVQNQNASRTKIQKVLTKNIFLFPFFRRDALKEQFGKEPSTVRCLAVKKSYIVILVHKKVVVHTKSSNT